MSSPVVAVGISEEAVAVELSEVLLAAVRGEHRCGSCGYGIATAEQPAECPMCRASDWQPVAWRPFTHLPEFVSVFSRRAS